MNGLDIFIIVCIGIGLIKGLFDGIIKQVISLVSLIAIIFFAGRTASFLRDRIFSSVTLPDYVLTGLCYIFAFLLITIIFHLLRKLIEGIIKKTPVSPLNHLLGGILGSATIIILLSLIFNMLITLDPKSSFLSKQMKEESVLFVRIKAIIPFLYPFIRNYLEDQRFLPEQEENLDPYLNRDNDIKEVSI